ncbi:MAG: extracellular solute-binding protein [Firmicutes bacterium]|nr:extracellular solute-binding protein [Bacillota bacterium]
MKSSPASSVAESRRPTASRRPKAGICALTCQQRSRFGIRALAVALAVVCGLVLGTWPGPAPLGGFSGRADLPVRPGTVQAAPHDPHSIVVASTTSTQDSGIFDVILPVFEKNTGIRVKVVAVGTGQAIELAERGDADVIFVHARASEEEFVAKGFGVRRYPVMYNDFVIVGPAADPAGIGGGKDAVAAFRQIAAKQALFVSRGDNSGTHIKEKEIWKAAGLVPKGGWYKEAGTGMGNTLRMADEMGAYTLADRSTYLHLQSHLRLKILVQGDRILFNPYGVTAVNPRKFPDVNYAGAQKFIQFLTSPEGQKLIGEYGREQFGQPLFFPAAGSDL